jgi:hypothetical protein
MAASLLPSAGDGFFRKPPRMPMILVENRKNPLKCLKVRQKAV